MMVTMFLVGRISHAVDLRILVAGGLAICAASLWMMTGWSLEMDWRPVVLSGFVQGLGLGFVFVPLNILSFATLPAELRTEAAGLLALVRNLGSSIGIAVMAALLSRNMQVSHADMVQHLTFQSMDMDPALITALDRFGTTALAMLNAEAGRQAAMIAYLDDFKVMMIATLCAIPLVLLLRKPRTDISKEDDVHMVME
jgi:DHA2 family multidrug resistance protein